MGGACHGWWQTALFNQFICRNCQAFYQVVKVEASPETDMREMVCRACGGPLIRREGKFGPGVEPSSEVAN